MQLLLSFMNLYVLFRRDVLLNILCVLLTDLHSKRRILHDFMKMSSKTTKALPKQSFCVICMSEIISWREPQPRTLRSP